MTHAAALALTLLTGFTGLVYQVTWQKYLATLLGSHGAATAAVLGLFLGGLSLGYRIFGGVTGRLVAGAAARGRAPRLLLAYGAVEIGIGAYACAFPWLFRLAKSASYALPWMDGGLGFAADVLLAALLIGPPAILMGATIPLLTQALSRSLDAATRIHALVYGLNTLGAFAGALASGFVLLPWLGLDRVLLVMGVLNLGAGSLYALLGVVTSPTAPRRQAGATPRIEGAGLYSVVAALLGFAMMTLETSLIRLAGLSFGSSEYTFSMVVAAFVLCIALGATAVSFPARIPRFAAALVLWVVALLLFGLYFALADAPYFVYALRTAFRDSAAGFHGFYLLAFLLILTAIALPVLLSGAALPLLFHHLRREFGELGSMAGRLYGWNTVGSVLGALLGGYALFFWLDLHAIYRVAVAALLLAALLLTIRLYTLPWVTAAAAAPFFAALALQSAWDPQLLSLGLFRKRETLPRAYEGFESLLAANPDLTAETPIFHDDDPTATIMVRRKPEREAGELLSLIVNGKSDGNSRWDYPTMGLLGLLPALFADDPERAFVIGWGMGVSAGELAALEGIERVTVAEISPAVLRAAPLFDPVNLAASKSPKLELVQTDAYRALSRSREQYDVIVSEPSNPWVGGVEMLYSREFLELARRRLAPGGVYAQWFHQYDTNAASMEMVLRTFAGVFEHVSVWMPMRGDVILLGFENLGSAIDHFRLAQRVAQPGFRAALARSGVESFAGLLAREVLPVGVVHATRRRGPLHTLYHPRLSHLAGRGFFEGGFADVPFTGRGEPARVGARNSLLRRYAKLAPGGLSEAVRADVVREGCRVLGAPCATLLAQWLHEVPDSEGFRRALAEVAKTRGRGSDAIDAEDVTRLAGLFEGPSIAEARGSTTPAQASRLTNEYVSFYHHAAPFEPGSLIDAWSRCRPEPLSREKCEAAIARSRGARGEIVLEDEVERCSNTERIGSLCREGLESAHAMFDAK